METHASYRLVGAFVLALVLGSFAFVVWLAGVQVGARFARYDIYFSGPVTGLRLDSPVSYRGIHVGRVREITIDPTNVERIRVTIEVQAETPIRQDSEASLRVEGLVGATFVLLSGGMQASPPLTARPGEVHPVIAAKSSPIEDVIESAPRLVQRVEELLSRMNTLLNEANVRAAGRSLAHLDTFTGGLAAASEDIRTLAPEARALIAELRDASRAFTGLATALGSQATRLTDSATRTVDAIGETAAEVRRAVGDVTREIPATLTAINATAAEIQRAVGDVARGIPATLKSIDEAARAVPATLASIDEAARGVPATLASVGEAARAATGTLGSAGRELPATIDAIREAARDVSRAADGLTALIDENRRPLQEFTTYGLIQLSRFLTEAREAVERVGRVAKETEADPQRFLFGEARRGYDVPR